MGAQYGQGNLFRPPRPLAVEPAPLDLSAQFGAA
jgi:hypothetical protein